MLDWKGDKEKDGIVNLQWPQIFWERQAYIMEHKVDVLRAITEVSGQ